MRVVAADSLQYQLVVCASKLNFLILIYVTQYPIGQSSTLILDMSDYSPPPKPGYTRSGKSLKAVRRYYALKENSRKKRSPDAKDEDDQDQIRRGERSPPSSRRKRSPEDDKLSKRIQAELETQREANEKRAKNLPPRTQLERGASTQLVHLPRESGPVLVAEPDSARQYRSGKSLKSYKSVASYTQNDAMSTFVFDIGVTAVGCIVTCFIIALVYMITWIFMIAVDKYRFDIATGVEKRSSLKMVGWLALTSVLVMVAVPYWLKCKSTFKHALICLTLMILSTFCLIVQVFYIFLSDDHKSIGPQKVQFASPNPLGVCLLFTYLLYHVISISFMTKQLLNLVSRQIGEKSAERTTENLQMSQYLAPT